MKVHTFELEGLKLIELDYYADLRGGFYETFSKERYEKAGLPFDYVQDNSADSVQGVVRGLHFQWPFPQGKLIWAASGEIYDVAVDIRKSSPTYGKYQAVVLSAENRRQYSIPGGFAHGYQVISSQAVVCYKCAERYCPEAEHSILWNDPEIGIEWPLPNEAILSDKDFAAPLLAEMERRHLPD